MTDVKEDTKQISPTVINALTAINKITYDTPAQIGITKRITHQEDQFTSQSYTGGEMLLIAQTGSAFVDPYDSWLKFDFAVTVADAASTMTFGTGSMANFFDEILIESRTGQDLSRLRSASLFIKNYQDWNHSPQWKATEGIAQYYPPKTDFKENATPFTIGAGGIATATATVCMRMSDLMPCFRPLGGRLLPPQFMEGLRVRIILNSGAKIGVITGGAYAAPTYSVNNPRIQWSVYMLDDVFKRKIQEIASTRGLVVMYKEVHQQQAPTNGTSFDNEVNKAVSKALRAYVVPRLSANVTPTALAIDPNTSEIFAFRQVQSRIGNDYFPQKALTSTAVTDFREFYTYCLHSMGYVNKQDAPVVQPQNGVANNPGCYGSADAENSKACMIFNYNKSSVSDLDGYTINNSRSLLFNFIMHNANAVRMDTFLEYLRVAIVFNSNIDVKD